MRTNLNSRTTHLLLRHADHHYFSSIFSGVRLESQGSSSARGRIDGESCPIRDLAHVTEDIELLDETQLRALVAGDLEHVDFGSDLVV